MALALKETQLLQNHSITQSFSSPYPRKESKSSMKMEGNPQPTWELGQMLRPRNQVSVVVHLPKRGRRKKVYLMLHIPPSTPQS